MDVTFYFTQIQKKIKFLLIFFCALVLINCKQNTAFDNIYVHYEQGKAKNVQFKAKESSSYAIYLKQNDVAPVLGDQSHANGTYTFTPIVSFAKGQTYEIRENGTLRGSFTIDVPDKNENPRLVAIYPSVDSVPQNLLKMYFEFSEPMQHSKNALDFIKVIDETTQEESDVFLEMQTELWNKERTRLTLWLDPGRIKTDLIPNRERGLPLTKNHSYTLYIDSLWNSAKGQSLSKNYSKVIHVIEKDLDKPIPEQWNIIVPERNTQNPLKIKFNEPLDAILALESINVLNNNGTSIQGSISLSGMESILNFKPKQNWTAGKYSIVVNPVLEDLAGNTLERLFDTDLLNEESGSNKTKNILTFSIKN